MLRGSVTPHCIGALRARRRQGLAVPFRYLIQFIPGISSEPGTTTQILETDMYGQRRHKMLGQGVDLSPKSHHLHMYTEGEVGGTRCERRWWVR